MKINKLLLAAAVSASIVGCSEDSFVSEGLNNTADNLKGKLVDAQLLGVGRGDDAQTRAMDNFGNFIWMPQFLIQEEGENKGKIDVFPGTTERSNQRIGFCWVGTNSKDENFELSGVPNANVYTNYEYEHVGWLGLGEEAPIPDPCDEDKLLNGAFIVGEGNPEAKFESTAKDALSAYQYQAEEGKTALGKFDKDGVEADLHLGSGVFKTENSSVFEGDYLVYFPYTDKFIKGPILATQPESYTIDVTKDEYRTMSDHAFAIGYVKGYDGGKSMASFTTKNLSSFVALKFVNSKTTNNDPVTLKKVILYSATGIIYEQLLDAAKCVTALENNGAVGENLYYGEGETTNAVYATLMNGASEGVTIVDGKEQIVRFPILPQTVSDLKIILVNDKDQTYEMKFEKPVFNSQAYGSQVIELDNSASKFTNTYMVVDEETLASAMDKIFRAVDAEAQYTIKMLKSIKLEKTDEASLYPEEHEFIFNKNITITADPSAENVTLTLAADNYLWTNSMNSDATLTMDVPFIVEGAGCCGTYPAIAYVGGQKDVKCNVVYNKPITNYGTFMFGSANDVDVKVNAKLTNAYDGYAIDRKKTVLAGKFYIMGGKNTDITIDEVENYGKMMSIPQLWNFGDWDSSKNFSFLPIQGTPTARVIKATIGTLTNNVTEGIEKSGEITIDGYSELFVEKALTNNAAALIKTANVQSGVAQSNIDGRLTTKGSAQNDGIIDNNGVLNLEKDEMLNNGLVIDQLSGQLGGYKVVNATGANTPINYDGTTYATDLNKGMYVSKVATASRLKFALTDVVEEPSCNIIEIVGMDVTFFNLVELDPSDKLENKDVYVAHNGAIFKALNNDNTAAEKYFGHCVTVRKNNKLTVKDGVLSTKNNVNVEKSATFLADKKFVSTAKSEVVIGGNLNNSGTTTHDAEILTVNIDLNNNADATFTSNNKFDVKGNVTTSGTFDSNGDDNTVIGNFAQKDGKVTFAYKTTTDVGEEFSCEKGTFERETLGNDPSYRATVNVGSLGSLKGTNNGGWPTVR